MNRTLRRMGVAIAITALSATLVTGCSSGSTE